MHARYSLGAFCVHCVWWAGEERHATEQIPGACAVSPGRSAVHADDSCDLFSDASVKGGRDEITRDSRGDFSAIAPTVQGNPQHAHRITLPQRWVA